MRPIVLLLVLFVAGCSTVKTKNSVQFCVGACIRVESDVEKKGEDPKVPAPDAEVL